MHGPKNKNKKKICFCSLSSSNPTEAIKFTDKHLHQLWDPPDCQSVGKGDSLRGARGQIFLFKQLKYCSEQQSLYVFTESAEVQLTNELCSSY